MVKKWTAALEGKRNKGDGLADELVTRVVVAGGTEKEGEERMRQMIRRIVSVPGIPLDLHQDMNNYFSTEHRPEWVDEKKINQGTEVFVRHGVEISVILLCASLPACYADAPGINALDITHQLTNHPLRRVIETMRFVTAVLTPGNLLGNAPGAITAKKVRMLHALNRRMLHTLPESRWKEKDWGLPLNQEDLALTLMTFATVVLDSLAKLSLYVSPEEQESYVHTWRYIGYLMGVDKELLPENIADGRALFDTIKERVYAESAAGKELTKALIDMVESFLPNQFMDGMIAAKIRLYMGDKVADMLGVRNITTFSVESDLLNVVKFVHRMENDLLRGHQILGFATDSLGRLILKGLEEYERTDEREQFHVPDELRDEWNLVPPKSAVVTGSPQSVAPSDESADGTTTIAATSI